ncbi:hypothetical protein IT568_11025, partial [bacterium]|nr:hypothetical protein [bacterium]
VEIDENFPIDAETVEIDENFPIDAETVEIDENFPIDAETTEIDESFLIDAETTEIDENFPIDAETVEIDESFPIDAETTEIDENFQVDAETKEVELSPLERLKAIRKAKEKNDTEALNKLSGFNEQDFENDSELPELDETSQNKIIDPKFGITNIDDFQSILNETLKLNPKEDVQEDFNNLYELEPKEETKVVLPEPKPSKPALDSRGQINSPLLVRIYVEQELYGKAIDLLENRKKTEKTDKYDSEIEKYKKLLAEQKEAEKKSKR